MSDLFDAIRDIKANGVATGSGKLTQVEVDRINAILRPRPKVTAAEPKWIEVARSLLGTKEIPGPQHTSFIAKGWARLGAGWFNDDETPWCGFFVAHCMDAAGLPYPGKGMFARAAAWADYGTPCTPQLGAIGVKKRTGGNHVFFIVGETADKRFYKALGGNQGNMVSVMDIAKSDVFAIRWPPGAPELKLALPVMAKGTVSRNEA